MAVQFSKNLANWLGYGNGAIGSQLSGLGSISVAGWVFPLSLTAGTTDNGMITMMVSGTTVGIQVNVDGSVAGGKVRMSARSSSADARQGSLGATVLNAGVWNHIGGRVIFGTTKEIHIFLNGVVDGGVGTLKTFAATTFTTGAATAQDTIGGIYTPTPTTVDQLDGHIAEVGIWAGQLTDDDFAALAQGYEPMLVRPDLLLDAVSLLDNTRINGVAGKISGTITGSVPSSSVDHPRILRA